MKIKSSEIVGFSFIVLALIGIAGLQAQQTTNKLRTGSTTTNWIGCLVVGTPDAVDQIAPGPHPATVREIEIGLRSDGFVVWRAASKVK